MSFTFILIAILAGLSFYFTQNGEGMKQLAALKQSMGMADIKKDLESQTQIMNNMLDQAADRNGSRSPSGILNNQSADQTQEMLRKSMVPTLNGKPLQEALPDVTKLKF